MLAFARPRQAPCACDFIYAHSFVEIQTRLEFDDSIRRANSLLECMKTGKPMEDGLSHRLTQSECNRNQINTKKYRKIRSFTSETITSCSPFFIFHSTICGELHCVTTISYFSQQLPITREYHIRAIRFITQETTVSGA